MPGTMVDFQKIEGSLSRMGKLGSLFVVARYELPRCLKQYRATWE